MSDITAVLQPAIAEALRGDNGVNLAFGMAPVRIYGSVPNNAVPPYLVLVPGPVEPIQADGFDLSTSDWDVQVWSRPNPPTLTEAVTIAQAVRACMLAVSVSAGGQVLVAQVLRSIPPLPDIRDPRLFKAVVATRFTTAPANPA